MTFPTQADWSLREDGPRLVVTRRLRQPPERVWAAISTPARIADWLGVEWIGDTGPLTLGGRFDYRFTNVDMVSLGRVIRLEPPRLLEHTWHENTPPASIVRWALEADGPGCRLTLTQRAGPPEDGPRTAAGWTMLFESLAASLGEADAVAGGVAEWRDLRDGYAKAFPPVATRDGRRLEIDGHPALRFERRLSKPPEDVWRALVEPDALARWLQADEVIIEPTVGGRFHLRLGGGSSRMDGRILRWEPERLLEYTWPETAAHGDSHVCFEIFADAAGSRLVLTHVLRAGGDLADFGSGWHWHLDALEQALEGAAVAFDHPRWAALRQAYAATL